MLGELPPGCAFNPRCPNRFDRCTTAPPPDYPVGPEHVARCFLHDPADPRPFAVGRPAPGDETRSQDAPDAAR
jgi:hypothetical protein